MEWRGDHTHIWMNDFEADVLETPTDILAQIPGVTP